RLCELNVGAQVLNVCETTIVEDAWARGQALTVHGLIYGIEDGLLRDLAVSVDSPERRAELSPAAARPVP
ncbi:MAG TPA: carbonic anhydrase, partial [Gaiellaceae bacterium]|nr:carbonic anhydrase [Gaiellaceae bacterium]